MPFPRHFRNSPSDPNRQPRLLATATCVSALLLLTPVPGGARAPWSGGARPITATYLEVDIEGGLALMHDGIDYARNQNSASIDLFPLEPSVLCGCNDFSADGRERYVWLRGDNSGKYYEYYHIDQNSVVDAEDHHVSCQDATNCRSLAYYETSDKIATGLGPATLQVGALAGATHGVRDSRVFPIDIWSDLNTSTGNDTNDPPATSIKGCTDAEPGDPVSGLVKARDVTWTTSDFPTPEDPAGYVTGVYAIELFDHIKGRVDSSMKIVYLNTTWTDYDPSPIYEMDFGEAWIRVQFDQPGPSLVLHDIYARAYDYAGNAGDPSPEGMCASTLITRSITDFTALGGNDSDVFLQWYAMDFDPGTTFTVTRSADGGKTYDYTVGGAAIWYQSDGWYYLTDEPVQRRTYCYKILDSEGGPGIPGPDPEWGPVKSTHPTWGVVPNVPTGAPGIAITEVRPNRIYLHLNTGVANAEEYEISSAAAPDEYNFYGEQFPSCEANGAVSGLPYTNEVYYFASRAVNVHGAGPPSIVLAGRTLADCEVTNAVGLYDAIYVMWSPVEGASAYSIEYQSTMAPWEKITVMCASSCTSRLVTGVAAGEYAVGVRAMEEFGHLGGMAGRPWVTVGTTTGAPDTTGTVARKAMSVIPNPVEDGGVRIRWEAAQDAGGRIQIYDAGGRGIRELVLAPRARGEIWWDLLDSDGHRVPHGAYFVRAWGSGVASTKKVIVVR